MKPSLFQVSGICVQAGKFTLQDISFSLERKEYLIVLGPTGCGKTMLLETLAGLRKPMTGEIFLEDKRITYWPPEKRGLGFAYQDSLLYPFLNVKENILFGAKAKKMHKQPDTLRRLNKLAEAMNISHLLQRFPCNLSGGERQRVSLARAILVSPPLLLLDEPLSALDPLTRNTLRNLLQEIQQREEMGIIHVTHDFNEALQLGTRVMVMNQGKVLQQGETLTVFNQPCSLFVADFLQSENIVSGKIVRENGAVWFKSSENNWVLGPLPEKPPAAGEANAAWLILHAGQIEVSSEADFSRPNRKSWEALVAKVTVNSSYVELICKGNGRWHVSLSRNEWEKIAAEVGSKVFLALDPRQIHLITNP